MKCSTVRCTCAICPCRRFLSGCARAAVRAAFDVPSLKADKESGHATLLQRRMMFTTRTWSFMAFALAVCLGHALAAKEGLRITVEKATARSKLQAKSQVKADLRNPALMHELGQVMRQSFDVPEDTTRWPDRTKMARHTALRSELRLNGSQMSTTRVVAYSTC